MELLVFVTGMVVGSMLTTQIIMRNSQKILKRRGDALKAITLHQWNTGKYNDAVVITRLAVEGLKND